MIHMICKSKYAKYHELATIYSIKGMYDLVEMIEYDTAIYEVQAEEERLAVLKKQQEAQGNKSKGRK